MISYDISLIHPTINRPAETQTGFDSVGFKYVKIRMASSLQNGVFKLLESS